MINVIQLIQFILCLAFFMSNFVETLVGKPFGFLKSVSYFLT